MAGPNGGSQLPARNSASSVLPFGISSMLSLPSKSDARFTVPSGSRSRFALKPGISMLRNAILTARSFRRRTVNDFPPAGGGLTQPGRSWRDFRSADTPIRSTSSKVAGPPNNCIGDALTSIVSILISSSWPMAIRSSVRSGDGTSAYRTLPTLTGMPRRAARAFWTAGTYTVSGRRCTSPTKPTISTRRPMPPTLSQLIFFPGART